VDAGDLFFLEGVRSKRAARISDHDDDGRFGANLSRMQACRLKYIHVIKLFHYTLLSPNVREHHDHPANFDFRLKYPYAIQPFLNYYSAAAFDIIRSK
jgi:hypothetical protein